MQRAMERHAANDARVIPIILRACDWHNAPFGKLQGLPKDGKPVTSWTNRDEAFANIALGIRKVTFEFRMTVETKTSKQSKPLLLSESARSH
jgi:hypothetical protein